MNRGVKAEVSLVKVCILRPRPQEYPDNNMDFIAKRCVVDGTLPRLNRPSPLIAASPQVRLLLTDTLQ